jgi:hypothetical protein
MKREYKNVSFTFKINLAICLKPNRSTYNLKKIIACYLFFDRSHPVVFCNNIVIYSVNKHNIHG